MSYEVQKLTSQRNKISPVGLFFLLYVCRIVVALTTVSALTFNGLSSDLLISICISLVSILLLSLPIIFCYKINKSPFDIPIINMFYCAFFIFMASVNISRFSYFTSTTLNPQASSIIFVAIISLGAWYCIRFGIEGIGRFSAVAFVFIVIGIVLALWLNVKNYNTINLYPFINSSTKTIINNSIIITGNTTELIMLLCLKNRVNGSGVKSYVFSVLLSYVSIFLIVLFCIGTMGDSAQLQGFPIYTLFQITKLGNFERIDVLHITFWIVGIFIKTITLQYCAVNSINKLNNGTKCTFVSVLSFLLALLMSLLGFTESIKPETIHIPFFVFAVLIPTLCLIFKKRSFGDELIKKFQ